MEIKKVLSKCDYTLLDRCASYREIEGLITRGERYGVAAICIPPCFIGFAKRIAKLPICTVIGFPNGYNSASVKLYEAREALDEGADELDMVINVGMLKSGQYGSVQSEISSLKKACGDKILKVIIEASLLTDDEKLMALKLLTDGGADFVKTGTGFCGGATEHDVKLLCENAVSGIKVKAAGGIGSVEAAERFLKLGAERIGTSKLIDDALAKGLIN